jgi:hypothetical protein
MTLIEQQQQLPNHDDTPAQRTTTGFDPLTGFNFQV